MSITLKTAKKDILDYLFEQSDAYFSAAGTTRDDVVENDDIITALAEEHRKCVNEFGNDREWSKQDACDAEPGLYHFVPLERRYITSDSVQKTLRLLVKIGIPGDKALPTLKRIGETLLNVDLTKNL